MASSCASPLASSFLFGSFTRKLSATKHHSSCYCSFPSARSNQLDTVKVDRVCFASDAQSRSTGMICHQQFFPVEFNSSSCLIDACEKLENVGTGGSLIWRLAFVAIGSALLVAGSHVSSAAADQEEVYQTYFGTAASASSYGGYGGNSSKRDSAEYTFDVPQGWKERLISKVEKGTNGTDSEFYNPRRKEEKVYLTFLPGFRRLAPRDSVLNNLALSDVSLQDMLSQAESVKALDKTDSNGQLYYEYEIDSPIAHSLISVTCAKNKLYAHFVKAPVQDWNRDESLLRHVHDSFTTVGPAPALSSP